MLKTYLHTAERAALDAGHFLVAHFSKLKHSAVHRKEHQELVTDFDRQANRRIVQRLHRQFPDHSIRTEEGGDMVGTAGYTWMVDPLDGTKNYVLHIPFFAVSIALTVNGSPILGVVYAPDTDELFTAIAGQGAFHNQRALTVTRTRRLNDAVIGLGDGHGRPAIKRGLAIQTALRLSTKSIWHTGSTALNLACVGAGRFDAAILAGPVRPYDALAGIVIAREAGAEISDLAGQTFTSASRDLLVSNSLLHRALLKKLHSTL